MRSEIKKLSYALAKGTLSEEYSAEKAQDVIRGKINELCGGEFNYYSFMDNKYKVFAILAESLEVATSYIDDAAMDVLVEYKDANEGDSLTFMVEDPSLFSVAHTAIGTNDIIRQRLSGKKIPTVEFNLSVKIYEELKLFMAGRVDFAKMITKVAKSFNVHVANLVAQAMFSSYKALQAPYLATGAFDKSKMLDLVGEIEMNGQAPIIMGTKKAVSHLIADLTDAPESVKEQVWNAGFIGNYFGSPVVVLPQGRNAKGEKVCDDKTLIVIPQGEKPVKFAWAGQALVAESMDGTDNTAQQVEYMMSRPALMAVISYNNYALYRITG